jgi:hypothetical protein
MGERCASMQSKGENRDAERIAAEECNKSGVS